MGELEKRKRDNIKKKKMEKPPVAKLLVVSELWNFTTFYY